MRQVFLDTETTGLSAATGDRIVEIGCIEYIDRRDSGRRLHHYVNPGRSSHPDAVRVHGITDQFLADKPPFAQVAAEVTAFLAGAEVIIHNAAFDTAFIDAEFERLGLPKLAACAARITDSLLMAREQFPGKANSLDALCKRLEVDNSGRELHGALLDAGLLAEVYLRMTRGQGSLVIEAGESKPGQGATQGETDLSRFTLPVIAPSEDEAAAHAAVLKDVKAASKGKLVWNLSDAPAPA
jgi:DNA polymerase-3 subunit epsilon